MNSAGFLFICGNSQIKYICSVPLQGSKSFRRFAQTEIFPPFQYFTSSVSFKGLQLVSAFVCGRITKLSEKLTFRFELALHAMWVMFSLFDHSLGIQTIGVLFDDKPQACWLHMFSCSSCCPNAAMAVCNFPCFVLALWFRPVGRLSLPTPSSSPNWVCPNCYALTHPLFQSSLLNCPPVVIRKIQEGG